MLIVDGVIVEMYGKDGYTYHFNSVKLEETDKNDIVYGAAVIYWFDQFGV